MKLSDMFRKSGGGRLHNRDLGIVSVTFTTEPPFENKKNNLFAVVVTRDDTQEKDDRNVWMAGKGDQWVISDDGDEITPVEGLKETPRLFGTFIDLFNEACALGLEEGDEFEIGGSLNFRSFVGARVHFMEEKDEAQMARIAKDIKDRGSKSTYYTRYTTDGQKKGTDKRTNQERAYDIKTPHITEVLSQGEEFEPREVREDGEERTATPTPINAPARNARAATSKSTNGSGKAVNGSGNKTVAPRKKSKDDGAAEVDTRAREMVQEAFTYKKSDKLRKSDLNLAFTRCHAKADDREEMRKYVYLETTIDAWQADGFIAVEKGKKDPYITLSASE